MKNHFIYSLTIILTILFLLLFKIEKFNQFQQIKRKSNANFTKILKETDDPLSFFPWRKMIHFNKNGYALLGDAIIENVYDSSLIAKHEVTADCIAVVTTFL